MFSGIGNTFTMHGSEDVKALDPIWINLLGLAVLMRSVKRRGRIRFSTPLMCGVERR